MRDLRILTTLAERRHFARTAEEFDLSQPSLSAAIKKIEAAFGVALFERTSRRVALTPEGEGIVRQAYVVLESAAELSEQLRPANAPLIGRHRLGVIPTLAPYYLPGVYRALREAFPQLTLTLTEALTEELLRLLRNRGLDGVLMATPDDAHDLNVLPLFREPFVLAVPEDHPLAAQDRVTTDDVPVEELLLLEPGNCLRDQTLTACGTGFLAHRRPVHAAGLETLRAIVAAGDGCAVLPALAAVPTPGVRLLCFVPPLPGREIALVTRGGGRNALDARTLAAFLRNLARGNPALQSIGSAAVHCVENKIRPKPTVR